MKNARTQQQETQPADAPCAPPGHTAWRSGTLTLRFDVVWSVAWGSLRLRIGRALLTLLTIATAAAFVAYLLASPPSSEPAEQRAWRLMVALSLAVSLAGVVNTMVMSVAQRAREIGTLKCIGALDSLILGSLLVEAALLGTAGSLLGAAAGLSLSLLLAVADHGAAALRAADGLHLLGVGLLVVVGGLLLTMLGAVIPAWIAARLPPMEAMRGEK